MGQDASLLKGRFIILSRFTKPQRLAQAILLCVLRQWKQGRQCQQLDAHTRAALHSCYDDRGDGKDPNIAYIGCNRHRVR